MILTNVFDDLSDPVIIFNLDGELSYANTAAKVLVQGETVDTFGIGPLQRIFRQLEQRELVLPLSFDFRTDKQERYKVTINHLYSAYVVHCRRLSRSVSTHELRQKTVNMLHDYLSEPLEKYEMAMEDMLAVVAAKQLLHHADKAKFNSLVQQSRRLSARISQIDRLGELYFSDSPPDPELISVNQLLNKLIQHPETSEELENRIILQSESEDTLYCDRTWLLSAITACVRQLLTEAGEDQLLVITHTTNKYFHQITMTLGEKAETAVPSVDARHGFMTYREHEITEIMNLDLLIAARVIDTHGGQLKFRPGETGGLLIELPFDGNKANKLMPMQVKRFAQDLAGLATHSTAQSDYNQIEV